MTVSGGFTLLEGVIVILLLAILLIVATPRWPGGLLLEAQAERLAQDLRYAQALTLGREYPHTVHRVDSGHYRIVDANGVPLPMETSPLEGVTVEPFSISFIPPMGAPAADYPPIHLSMGDASLTLTVTPMTGTVLLQP